MKKITLTLKQQKTLDVIKEFIDKTGEAPTITELRKSLGLSSLRSVAQRIESLEAKGLIKRNRFRHRGITLIEDGPRVPFGTVRIPVIASAGCDEAQVYAQEQHDEYLMVDKGMVDERKKIVAIKALGNSMLDAGIHNGDYVLVEVTDKVSDGDRVAAILGDMAVIKRLQITPNAFVLKPESENAGYSSIIMSGENSRIFGKVLSVIPMSTPVDEYEYIPYPDE